MEANKIITSNLLDIIFEGRNKDYGAYQLGKNYYHRMTMAFTLSMCFAFLLIAGVKAFLNSKNTIPIIQGLPNIPDVNLSSTPLQAKAKIKIIAQHSNAQNAPVIVEDKNILKPTENTTSIETLPGDLYGINAGNNLAGISEPIVEKITETPPVKKIIKDHSIHQNVDVQAIFPGGEHAWIDYVSRAIRDHLDELSEAGESLTVRLKFVVEKDGTVSSVEVENSYQSKLASVAIEAIRKGPKWIPAVINGEPVRAYRIQPVTFQVIDAN